MESWLGDKRMNTARRLKKSKASQRVRLQRQEVSWDLGILPSGEGSSSNPAQAGAWCCSGFHCLGSVQEQEQ